MALERFLENLAEIVQRDQLSQANLNVKVRMGGKESFLETLLRHISRPLSSSFIVSNSLEYSTSYINALAITLNNEGKLHNLVTLMTRPYKNHSKEAEIIESRKRKLLGKMFWSIDMISILKDTDTDIDLWETLLLEMQILLSEKNSILVIQNIDHLFSIENKTKNHNRALQFFFATRPKRSLSFISPLNWQNYVSHIERGIYPLLIQHRTPFFLTPRPQNLPYIGNPNFSPDIFTF